MGVVAYLDAGSGSMVVGAIAAAGAGVAVAAKVGWRRVTGVLSPRKQASSADPEVAADAEAEASAPTVSDDA